MKGKQIHRHTWYFIERTQRGTLYPTSTASPVHATYLREHGAQQINRRRYKQLRYGKRAPA